MSNCEIYAPEYYNKFKCIADKCRHSCCIGWEICIDEETLEKYKNHSDIMTTIEENEDGHSFVLTNDSRCPHLNSCGLCDIIIDHGKDYLCEICNNHPRFYNHVYGGKIEAGLGIVCEEACRVVLENDKPFSLQKAEDCQDGEICNTFSEFNPLPVRDKIIDMIEANGDFDEKILSLQTKFGVMDLHSINEWIDLFLTLEILDDEWKKSLQNSKGKVACHNKSFDRYYDRLLTYFVYRHLSVADSENDLCARLGFAILSVKIIRHLFETDKTLTLQSLVDFARRYSGEIEYNEDNTYELIFEIGQKGL